MQLNLCRQSVKTKSGVHNHIMMKHTKHACGQWPVKTPPNTLSCSSSMLVGLEPYRLAPVTGQNL